MKWYHDATRFAPPNTSCWYSCTLTRDDSYGMMLSPLRIANGLSTCGIGGRSLSKLDLATTLMPDLFGLKSFIGVTGLRSSVSFVGAMDWSSLSRLRPLLPPRLEDSPNSSTTGRVCPCGFPARSVLGLLTVVSTLGSDSSRLFFVCSLVGFSVPRLWFVVLVVAELGMAIGWLPCLFSVLSETAGGRVWEWEWEET
jgi:hypothetical protein